jgi:hypothetical protein
MDLTRTHRREYNIWVSMRQRCNNPKNDQFSLYGGRGIKVCERWQKSFEHFLQDMGPKPDRMSLERVDNEQGYSPANCRWASAAEQSRNNRRTHFLSFNGETLPLVDWAKRLGIHHQTLRNRLKRGWPLQEALQIRRIDRVPIDRAGTFMAHEPLGSDH